MAKWFALSFGILGYGLVIWYYSVAFAPLSGHWSRMLMWHMCLSCVSVMGLHSANLRAAFWLLGPINAAAYAFIGLLLGKVIQVLMGLIINYEQRPH